MDPGVESALIGALVGVGGTAIVAFLGFRNARAALADALQANNEALQATRAGQLADLYTRAIDQLGSATVDITIGGIYALERIARDSPKDYHPTVMEVLAACIRENSGKPLQERTPAADTAEPATPERVIRPDIQAAMTVIARRDTKHDLRQINLRRVHLPGADLPSAHLSGADLYGAKLSDADLSRADLRDANLRDTNLSDANLSDADLLDANLRDADLSRADLRGANLGDTNLRDGNLRDGNLRDADLRRANLRGANLAGADLSRADLGDADLSRADLSGANLSGVNLNRANLSDAHLSGAVLLGAVLLGAQWPGHLPVPVGWELDTGSNGLQRVATGSESAEST